MRNLIVGCLLTALAFPTALGAAPYKLDKHHAHLVFSVDHWGFSLVRGRFTEFDTEIDFDPEDPESSSVSVTIQADSVVSFSEPRDRAIKGKALLDVSKFPTITFVSKEVELLDGNDALVTGDLTLRGVTQEATFKTSMRRAGVNELTMRESAGFSVEGEIDRREFDMDWGLGAIGATVEFSLDIETYVEE